MDSLEFYKKYGYWVESQAIPEEVCDALKQSFVTEIKVSNREMLRQRSVLYESHRFSDKGFIENALLNVHSLTANYYHGFYDNVFNVLTCSALTDRIAGFLGNQGGLVQTMYFESSRGTADHSDHYFLGVNETDNMLGVWIALEDIENDAGRFHVYPGSHLLAQESANEELMELYKQYDMYNQIAIGGHFEGSKKQQLKAVLRADKTLKKIRKMAGWERYSPALQKGDVLIFSSKTFHGSERPAENGHSRHSLTAHFVREDQPLIRFGTLTEKSNFSQFRGVKVHMNDRNLLPLENEV